MRVGPHCLLDDPPTLNLALTTCIAGKNDNHDNRVMTTQGHYRDAKLPRQKYIAINTKPAAVVRLLYNNKEIDPI